MGEPTTPPGGPLLLIVDDDDDAHFFLRRDLKRAGIEAQIEGVHSGESAVSYLTHCLQQGRRLPSLIFLDIKMPGMNGFTVLQWIRDQGLLGKLVVATLSSSAEPRDVARASELGSHDYLTKPATRDQLLKLFAAVSPSAV